MDSVCARLYLGRSVFCKLERKHRKAKHSVVGTPKFPRTQGILWGTSWGNFLWRHFVSNSSSHSQQIFTHLHQIEPNNWVSSIWHSRVSQGRLEVPFTGSLMCSWTRARVNARCCAVASSSRQTGVGCCNSKKSTARKTTVVKERLNHRMTGFSMKDPLFPDQDRFGCKHLSWVRPDTGRPVWLFFVQSACRCDQRVSKSAVGGKWTTSLLILNKHCENT